MSKLFLDDSTVWNKRVDRKSNDLVSIFCLCVLKHLVVRDLLVMNSQKFPVLLLESLSIRCSHLSYIGFESLISSSFLCLVQLCSTLFKVTYLDLICGSYDTVFLYPCNSKEILNEHGHIFLFSITLFCLIVSPQVNS